MVSQAAEPTKKKKLALKNQIQNYKCGNQWCSQAIDSNSLDLTQGQRALEHIGALILYDSEVIHSTGPLCGLCLCPSPLGQFFLGKEKGRNGKAKINQRISRGCLTKVNYSYSVAAESTASSPYSNVPIQCRICS